MVSPAFAPAGANKVLTIFSGGVYVGKNTFRPQTRQADLPLDNRKEDRPRPVGVDPPRRKVWDLPGCCAGQPEVGETAFLLKAQLPRHYDISAIILFCQGLI